MKPGRRLATAAQTDHAKHLQAAQGRLGQIYTPARYEYRGKVAKTRFERDCLAEYAEVFKTMCVDAAYYTRNDLRRSACGSLPLMLSTHAVSRLEAAAAARGVNPGAIIDEFCRTL
jgi:hypothetical protein